MSALNRTTTYPLFGTAMVSFPGGLLNSRCSNPLLSRSKACFKLIFFTLLSGDLPMPMTLNAYPWRWKGWDKLTCWTVESLFHISWMSLKLFWTKNWSYPHLRVLFPQWRSMECLLCECTCNCFHNSGACCLHCRTALVVCRIIERLGAQVEKRTIFRPLNWSRDHHLVPLKLDIMRA